MNALDRIDRAILAALAADARLSMTELAARVHLSRTAVAARVRQLEEAGIIRGYHADIRLPQTPADATALLLLRFSARPCAPVLAYLRGQPELRQLWSLSGPHDAVAEVTVAGPAALSALVDRLATSPYAIEADTRWVL